MYNVLLNTKKVAGMEEIGSEPNSGSCEIVPLADWIGTCVSLASVSFVYFVSFLMFCPLFFFFFP